MIKDKAKELLENSYQELKGKGKFNTKEEFWAMLVAETQRAIQAANQMAQCSDTMFECSIKGSMPLNQCKNDKGTSIIDLMIEKAETSLEKIVKVGVLLKRYKEHGVTIVEMPEH